MIFSIEKLETLDENLYKNFFYKFFLTVERIRIIWVVDEFLKKLYLSLT